MKNSTNIVTNYTGWDRANASRWNYRNYLMGTNSINLGATGQTDYFLQYVFMQTYPDNDALVYTYGSTSPANADYLSGITFLSEYADCTRFPYTFVASSLTYQSSYHPFPYQVGTNKTTENTTYYDTTQLKCVDVCLITTYQDDTKKACLPCHSSCLTCSAPYVSTACLSCPSNRVFDSPTNTCNLPPGAG